MLGIKQDFANFLPDCRVTGISESFSRNTLPLKTLSQQFCLRTLPATVRAVKNNEFPL
jgi:hypothetical protein